MKKSVLVVMMGFFLSSFTAGARGALTNTGSDMRNVRFTVTYTLTPSPGTSRIRFVALLPRTIGDRQDVLGIDYSLKPSRIFDENGSRYAEFLIEDPGPKTDIRIALTLALKRYDLSTAAVQAGPESTGRLFDWLQDEPYIERNDPQVVSIARSLEGTDELDTVRRLYDYVLKAIDYKGYVAQDNGAISVLARATGDCSDYADVLVTLSRAKNIPARTVDGYLVDFGNDTPRHTWVEIYTRKYGWVPFDPLHGDLKKVTFDRLRPNYIYLSGKRNDDVLNNYHFYAIGYRGGSVNIAESYRVDELNGRDGLPLEQVSVN